MVTRTVHYTDLDGNEIEQTLMFNINKMDKIRFMNAHPHLQDQAESLEKRVKEAHSEEEQSSIVEEVISIIEDIVKFSYGIRQGNKFLRTPDAVDSFMDSEAFSEFVASMVLDTNEFIAFVRELFPDADFSQLSELQ